MYVCFSVPIQGQSYLQLITLQSIKDSAESSWWRVASAQELKDLVKSRTQDRKPIQELVNAVKTGTNELKKAIVAFDHRASTSKRSATPGPAGKRKKAKNGQDPSVFDRALEHGKGICAFQSLEEFRSNADFNLPAVFRFGPPLQTVLGEERVVNK